ncbi:hypothetical protein AAH991_06330 [Microbispora sp. ZYX-F-249]|uniref:Spore protein YkvP/CgeB glycosyl transferase-like domain-containing protein n=1 Tax=Microbispora maris TaxID=3144104 RepID=A0ABV0AJ72_9ACTN
MLGRPLGLDAESVAALARRGVHVHLHGLVTAPGVKGAWASWLPRAVEAAPGRVHVHPHVDQRDWVRVLSRYDAGWLHRVRSANGGDLRVATWDDLNLPARIPPLMAAGVPLLQQRSPGCRVAADRLIEETGAGLLYDDLDGLADRLRDAAALRRARDAVAAHRSSFTFDAHADRLVGLFREVCR